MSKNMINITYQMLSLILYINITHREIKHEKRRIARRILPSKKP